MLILHFFSNMRTALHVFVITLDSTVYAPQHHGLHLTSLSREPFQPSSLDDQRHTHAHRALPQCPFAPQSSTHTHKPSLSSNLNNSARISSTQTERL